MARSPVEDFFQSGLGLVVVALFLILAMVVTPFFLVGAAGYIGLRLHLENPRRLERLARAETMLMYNHAASGCAFRGHPARDSDLIRPLIPI